MARTARRVRPGNWEDQEILDSYTGEQLIGMRYLPPFPYFTRICQRFQVLRGDFVTTDDGGVSHMAPPAARTTATTDTVGIIPVTPVDARADSTRPCRTIRGQLVFDANAQIIGT